mmetsp:Transcript_18266/g.34565  ORF Transcript_18266/g.34565 Transcript_18266/m.34565 type:complete len:209 (+) Transcript_18266:616-1242(+)
MSLISLSSTSFSDLVSRKAMYSSLILRRTFFSVSTSADCPDTSGAFGDEYCSKAPATPRSTSFSSSSSSISSRMSSSLAAPSPSRSSSSTPRFLAKFSSGDIRNRNDKYLAVASPFASVCFRLVTISLMMSTLSSSGEICSMSCVPTPTTNQPTFTPSESAWEPFSTFKTSTLLPELLLSSARRIPSGASKSNWRASSSSSSFLLIIE